MRLIIIQAVTGKSKGEDMRKGIIFGLLLVLMFTSTTLAGQVTVLKVKVEIANIRSEPDTSGTIVNQVRKGTLLEANSRIGAWFEIIIAAVSAYIHSRIVDVVTDAAPARQTRVAPQVPQPRQPVRQPQAVPAYSYGASRAPGKVRLLGGLDKASITYSQDSSDQTGADIGDYKKSKMGFLGGIGFEFGGRIGMEIDFLYMQKGVKFAGIYSPEGAGTGVDFDVNFMVNEITVPLMFKFKLMPGSTPYLLGGGEIAYILSSKIDYEAVNLGTDESYSGTEDLKEQDNMADLDYGLVLGAGYELVGGPIPISIEARYHMGLANLIKYDANLPEDVRGDDWVKSNALVLLVGIRF